MNKKVITYCMLSSLFFQSMSPVMVLAQENTQESSVVNEEKTDTAISEQANTAQESSEAKDDSEEISESSGETKEPTLKSTTMKISNFKGDDKKLDPKEEINSEIQIIEGTISLDLEDDTKADWYFKDNDGNQNALNTLELGGSFADGRVKEIKVDEKDPSKVNFIVETDDDNELNPDNKSMRKGIMTILAANNRFDQDLVAEITVDYIALASLEQKIDDSKKGEPVYKIKVGLEGGKSLPKLKKTDLSFEGAFENAKLLEEPKISKNKDSFTVKFQKSSDNIIAGDTVGKMILAKEKLKYNDGEMLKEDFVIGLNDTYIPKNQENQGSDVNDDQSNNKGESHSKETLAGLPEEAILTDVSSDINLEADGTNGWEYFNQISNLVKLVPGFGFVGQAQTLIDSVLGVVGLFTDKGISPEQQIMNTQTRIVEMLEKTAIQIDNAVKYIIGERKQKDLSDQLNNTNTQIEKAYVHGAPESLVKRMYSDMEKMKKGEKVAEENLSQDYIVLKKLYSTEQASLGVPSAGNSDFLYLDNVTNLLKSISQKGRYDRLDGFSAYEGYLAATNSFNTTTLKNRKQYNEYLKATADQHYTFLMYAITYDYEENVQKLEKAHGNVEKIKSIIENGNTENLYTSDGRQKLTEVLKEMENAEQNYMYRANLSAPYLSYEDITVDGDNKLTPSKKTKYQVDAQGKKTDKPWLKSGGPTESYQDIIEHFNKSQEMIKKENGLFYATKDGTEKGASSGKPKIAISYRLAPTYKDPKSTSTAEEQAKVLANKGKRVERQLQRLQAESSYSRRYYYEKTFSAGKWKEIGETNAEKQGYNVKKIDFKKNSNFDSLQKASLTSDEYAELLRTIPSGKTLAQELKNAGFFYDGHDKPDFKDDIGFYDSSKTQVPAHQHRDEDHHYTVISEYYPINKVSSGPSSTTPPKKAENMDYDFYQFIKPGKIKGLEPPADFPSNDDASHFEVKVTKDQRYYLFMKTEN